ncbi:MAG: hypothetical protein ABIS20_01215 [Thermoanaerobaculia bacterium]
MTKEEIDALGTYILRSLGESLSLIRQTEASILYPPFAKIVASFTSMVFGLALAEEPVFLPSEAHFLAAALSDLVSVRDFLKKTANREMPPETRQFMREQSRAIGTVCKNFERRIKGLSEEKRESIVVFRPREQASTKKKSGS